MLCELMVNPRASIVVSQPVLFLGAKIGVAPVSPGPNNARGLRLARPNRVTQSCHGPNVVPASVDSRPRTRWRRKGRTFHLPVALLFLRRRGPVWVFLLTSGPQS